MMFYVGIAIGAALGWFGIHALIGLVAAYLCKKMPPNAENQ